MPKQEHLYAGEAKNYPSYKASHFRNLTTNGGRMKAVKLGYAKFTVPGGLQAKDIEKVKNKDGTTSYKSVKARKHGEAMYKRNGLKKHQKHSQEDW